MSQDHRSWREKSTIVDAGHDGPRSDVGIPGLTVLWHPDPRRVGEEAGLTALLADAGESLSRLEPVFAAPGGTPRALEDPHLSRRPLRLTATPDGGVRLDPGATRTQLAVGGVPVSEPYEISRAELEAGAVLLIGQRVALLLHLLAPRRVRPPSFGLVGESAGMLRLREEIRGLADLDHPVLLRGESGTGKELVARALHEAAGRRGKLVCVNVGAIPPTLAAAELFGAERGAYSGADRKRTGHFQNARGGTLFLDEIGDASADVQVLLLRALESGEIQPVGASDPVAVDVRLVSATDADLEAAISVGELRSALYHRLSTCELRLPPLRDRREDFGRLFVHFLRQELETVGEASRLDPGRSADLPWVPAELVAGLAGYCWPGNVRELRNVVRQLVVASRGQSALCVPARVERLLREPPPPELRPATGDVAAEPASAYRHPATVSEEELLQALRTNRWNGRQSAAALNVSSTSLYSLMRKYRVRTASDLSREEIVAVLRRCDGRIDAMVDLLAVSERGLKLRMTELGLDEQRGEL